MENGESTTYTIFGKTYTERIEIHILWKDGGVSTEYFDTHADAKIRWDELQSDTMVRQESRNWN